MKANPLWAKRMSGAYIRVREVRGQVPGTTRGRACTKNYVRAPEGVARRGIGAEDPKPKT